MKLTLSGLLLLLAAVLIWFTFARGESVALIPARGEQNLVKTYLEGATRWEYNAEGQRAKDTSLAFASQRTDSDTTSAETLDFSIRDERGALWRVSANRARLDNSGAEAYLYDGVIIRHPERSATLTTDNLLLRIQQQRALTDADLTLTLPQGKTTARGLDANLKSGLIKLLADVETIYEG